MTRLRATIVVEYEVKPEHYTPVNNELPTPAEMSAQDEHDYELGAFGLDDLIEWSDKIKTVFEPVED